MSVCKKSRSAGASQPQLYLGALSAQLGLELPAIGGKDSMSGSFESLDVTARPGQLCRGNDEGQQNGFRSLPAGGFYRCSAAFAGGNETLLPNWDKLKAYYTAVYAKMEKGEIRSASVVKEGGAAAADCPDVFR